MLWGRINAKISAIESHELEPCRDNGGGENGALRVEPDRLRRYPGWKKIGQVPEKECVQLSVALPTCNISGHLLFILQSSS